MGLQVWNTLKTNLYSNSNTILVSDQLRIIRNTVDVSKILRTVFRPNVPNEGRD